MSPRRPLRPAVDADTLLAARRRRKRRERSRQRRRRAVLIGIVGFVAAAVAVGAGGFTGAVVPGCNLDRLQPVTVGQNSFVYAADGSLLGSIPAERNRQPVSLALISPWLTKGTVAIEDHSFFQHGGIDVRGIVRAAVADVKAGSIQQGGSTITQQLVRNLYIGNQRTFKRKLTEACLAIKLSHARTKDWILNAYMNQVYYGAHAYGVEAAAQTYFSKHARSLTLPQAALIAGLPQAPSVYDPFNRPQSALARRAQVLAAMLRYGDITATQYEEAVHAPLKLKPGKLYTHIREPYFFGYVRDELISEYGANTVRSGGLKVYTTIDPRIQRAATSAIKRVLYYRTDPAGAIVSIDPRNGWIRAMTAVTPGKRKNQFNFAAQAKRQAGSTFKTFVLTTAVNMGIDPFTTTYLSAPFEYNPSGTGSCDTNPPTAWCPQTFDHTYLGAVSIERGTLASDNTVYARLTLDVGPENVAAMAHRLGVQSSLKTADGAYVPSLGLGSIAVSPLDMASAYATLAAQGVYHRPIAIRKVVLSGGKTDGHWGDSHGTRVIPDGVAYEVTKILSENMTSGTGVGAYFGIPSAGKTGTTDNFADAWFCGYTPRLEATVWIGYPQAEIPMRSVHGIEVSGPTLPATVWRYFMEAAVGTQNAPDFPQPQQWPVWHAWHGQYEFSGGSYSQSYTPGPSTGYGAPSTSATTQATTAAAPPPTTTAPPVSTPPPPPTTTSVETTPPPTTEPPPQGQ